MRLNALPLAFLLTLLIAGCGYNVKAIKTFDESTSSLTGSFKDIVRQTEQRCISSRRIDAITTPAMIRSTEAQEYANNKCKPMMDENVTVALVADVVSGYANGLSLAVGVEPNYLDSELSNMASVAGELKGKSGEGVFKKDEITATAAVAKFLADAYTSHQIKKVTVEQIQQHKDLINSDVERMGLYVSHIYKKEVERNNVLVRGVLTDLESNSRVGRKDSVGKVIPYRLAQMQFADDLKDVDSADEVVTKFNDACADLIKANNDLEQNFSKLSKDAQLKSVVDFAKKAKAVRDSIKAIE